MLNPLQFSWLKVYTCILYNICTLTGHFIRYTLLVPGWTPFCLQNCINSSARCWKHSSEILVHIDMILSRSWCRFIGCTSMMRISRSTTSQRCSIGLRSGDCGGHLRKVNSLSCSRNQSEMIWAFWGIFVHTTATHWIFSLFRTSLCKPQRWLWMKIPVDQQFLKYSDQPVWHQQPLHVQSHLKPLSSPFWCSVWTSASRLHHI